MSIDITSALKNGAARTLARNGLLLVAIVFLLNAINQLLGVGVARWLDLRELLPIESDAVGTALFAIPPAVAGVLSLIVGLATIVVTVAALRVFVDDDTETLRSEHFTRNAVWAVVNVFVGTVVFAVAVALGFVAFVVPGLFLLVALAFWSVFVAVEDRNFVEGFGDSWALTRGNRIELFLLGVAVVLVSIVVTAVFGVPALIGGLVGAAFTQAAAALTTVFTLATLAQAYTQLKAQPVPNEELPVQTGAPGPDESVESA